MRDGFAAAFAEGFLEYQRIAERAAAQCDPLRSTGEYLRGFAEERGIIPAEGESEESIRVRLFSVPSIVTPDAIRGAVNRVLAPYTDKECTYSELELDGAFVHDGTAVWDSFVGTDPDYPDRYYDDLPYRLPGGWIPSSGLPRSFMLRVPPLESNDDTVSYVLAESDGIFVGDGTDASGSESDGSVAFSAFQEPKLASELYAAIVGVVETIKGQGITWSLIVDPSL